MDPLTGKNKTVSVTLDKNTATTRRLALEELTKKINQKKDAWEMLIPSRSPISLQNTKNIREVH